jgi:CcmD family protein
MGAFLLGELPALPLHEAGKYVAGAYAVLFVLVLVYVAIMAVRLSRIERELGELLTHSARAEAHAPSEPGALGVGRPRSTPAGTSSE